MLMYWTGDDCVNVVAFYCIADPCPTVVGKACQAVIGKKSY